MYRLLIVDDEPIIRQGIRQLIDLEALSIHEVVEAQDGVEALACVRENRPDILLADINMPNLDGLSLARTVKGMDRSIRVAVITGYDYFEYALAALKAGVDDFLLKPVSRNDIRLLLQKLIEGIKEDEARQRMLEPLQHLQDLTNAAGPNPTAYRDSLLRAMDEHAAESDFSLGTLAGEVNLSPGYVSSLFRQLFGIPFQEYLVKLRLERAKLLLLTTSAKVYEVAEKIGFEDPNYFSASFKKHFGVSPNQYRDLSAGGPV